MLWLIFVVAIVLAGLYWLLMSSYSQVFGKFPYKVDTTTKQIALTFDDGPNEPFTSELVEFLNSHGVKATFFQVGKNVAKFPETTRAMEKAGHVIGNHSQSHAFHKYFTEPNYIREIEESQAIITKVIGKTPLLFRPPWLWRYPLLFKTLRQASLQPVSGEFCHVFEVFHLSAKRIAKRTLAKVKPGAIIIFHDGYNAKGADRRQTIDGAKLVVNELIKQGYEFVTISQLLNTPAYR